MIATADLLDQQACQQLVNAALRLLDGVRPDPPFDNAAVEPLAPAAPIPEAARGWPGADFERPTDGVYAEVEVTVPPSGTVPQSIGPDPVLTTVGTLSIRVAYPAASGVRDLLTVAGKLKEYIWRQRAHFPEILFAAPTVARGGSEDTHRAVRVLAPFQSWRR